MKNEEKNRNNTAENKEDKYILNNRPMVENLNKNNQSWGLRSEKSINAYSLVLGAISVIISILFFSGGSLLFGFIFLGIAVLMALSVFLSKRAESKDIPVKREKSSSEAIFKEHDE
ncbi:MAG: hypothetical protein ACI4GZ_06885 [Ruminococcus sp.]